MSENCTRRLNDCPCAVCASFRNGYVTAASEAAKKSGAVLDGVVDDIAKMLGMDCGGQALFDRLMRWRASRGDKRAIALIERMEAEKDRWN